MPTITDAQSLTLVTVSSLHVSAMLPRVQPQGGPGGTGGEDFVSLLTTNYEQFHLPPDTGTPYSLFSHLCVYRSSLIIILVFFLCGGKGEGECVCI